MATDMLAALTRVREALATLEDSDAPVARSAQAVDVIDELARYERAVELDAAVRDQTMLLPVRLRALLDWNGRASSKPAVRAGASALVAQRPDGRSAYPMAVEALSYAAVCAPFLEPDPLTKLIEHCSATPYSYAPITRVAATTRDLRDLLAKYPKQRQVTLLTSLWDAAHDTDEPRWWNACSGRGLESEGSRRRTAAAHRDHAARLQAEAGIDTTVEVDGADGDDDATAVHSTLDGLTPTEVLTEVIANHVALSSVVCDGLRGLDLTAADPTLVAVITEWATMPHADSDVPVLLAQLSDLSPRTRPDNPIPRMVEAARMAWTGADGLLLADQMPDKPTSWSALFPVADLAGYPIPPQIYQFHGQRIDPPAGVDSQPFVIELCRNDNELQDNRTYMGNCTYDYRDSCQKGELVIGKIYHGRETYNFAWRHSSGDRWSLLQINGYQNRFDRVPGWVGQWARATAQELRAGIVERPDATTAA